MRQDAGVAGGDMAARRSRARVSKCIYKVSKSNYEFESRIENFKENWAK